MGTRVVLFFKFMFCVWGTWLGLGMLFGFWGLRFWGARVCGTAREENKIRRRVIVLIRVRDDLIGKIGINGWRFNWGGQVELDDKQILLCCKLYKSNQVTFINIVQGTETCV